jgi:hypothetical protein
MYFMSLAQSGYFGHENLHFCTLYGIVLLVLCVWMVFDLKRPGKDD